MEEICLALLPWAAICLRLCSDAAAAAAGAFDVR